MCVISITCVNCSLLPINLSPNIAPCITHLSKRFNPQPHSPGKEGPHVHSTYPTANLRGGGSNRARCAIHLRSPESRTAQLETKRRRVERGAMPGSFDRRQSRNDACLRRNH